MASIKDIAKLAGVSISTVSIIINGKSEERKISSETQEKVKLAMRELNYQPNLSAKKLRNTDTKKTIALFWTTDFRDVMLAQFLRGLQQQVNEKMLDYDIVIFPYENGQLYKEESLTKVSNFHGAIIANANQEDIEFLASQSPVMPIILYNRHLPNYSCVYVDDKTISQKVVDMLEGTKKVSLLTTAPAFEGMTIRDQGLIDLLDTRFHKQYIAKSNSTKAGYEIAASIDFQAIDTICCSSDMLALGLMHYCFENQIKIPEDLQILAIGNGLSSIDEYLNPSLSVVQIPLKEMAQECIALLSQQFQSSEIIRKEVKPIQIYRDSLNYKGDK